MTFQGMPRVPRGQAIPWHFVFTRWMNDRPALDRIDFVNVNRVPEQGGWYDATGPLVILRKERT